MRNAINLVMVTILLASLGMASVSDGTLITGKIYNADFTVEIAGANVEVTCNGNVQNAVSLSNGKYSVSYDKTDCKAGDSLIVSAEKDGQYAIKSGVVHENAIVNNTWDLGVVNVAIVPEFGFFLGMLTMLSAVGIFFVVRKE